MLEQFTFELTDKRGNRSKVCNPNGLLAMPKDGIEFNVYTRKKVNA